MAKNRIVLYGHFGTGNIGNDSSLEAALHHVRKYQAESDVVCVCSGPQEISKRFDIEALPINMYPELQASRSRFRVMRVLPRLRDELHFWLKYRSWFKPGDRFIVVGTGAADDMGVRRPWASPYELYKWCTMAKRGGAQLVFLSVGVGPIVNPLSRMLMLRALALADYRSYREKAAFDYLRSVGVDTTGDLLYPDLAFSLPKNASHVRQSADAWPKAVALGLMTYRGWQYNRNNSERIYQRYVSQIQAFAAWLLERGITVRIVPGDTIDSEVVRDVQRYFERRPDLLAKGSLVVEPVRNVDDLLAQIALTDLVVATRFHNVLSALFVGVPVISLGYHEKNVNLMASMGLQQFCQHIEQFTFEKLVEQFECYTAQREEAIERIREKKEEFRRLLDEQYRAVLLPAEHPQSGGLALPERLASRAVATS